MNQLPVAIIGAGPIGLAAAAHLHEYGVPFLVLEVRAQGGAVSEWGHVRLFSPWECNVDRACARLLDATGNWIPPPPRHIPTGAELVEYYLVPLANTAALRDNIIFGACVQSVTRLQADRSHLEHRHDLPFELTYAHQGASCSLLASAVIDASGLTDSPRAIGSNGLPIRGERECGNAITYGTPSPELARTIGDRVLIIGAGHTAMQCIAALTHFDRRIAIDWAIRQPEIAPLLRTIGPDRFPARLALQAKARAAVLAGQVTVFANSRFEMARATSRGVAMTWLDGGVRNYDRVLVAAGYKPELQMVRELQADFDPIHECPRGMRQVVDAARGACAPVPLHGEPELRHPERDFYVAGMRSFGRAPSFFLLAGYEQVRSIAARLAGDAAAVAPRPYMNMDETTLEQFLAENPYYLEEAFA